MQQASILGNMEEHGVLNRFDMGVKCDNEGQCLDDENKNNVPAVVEFGAGRGYLTQMLADCYGIKRVFLVERKSYKLKVSIEFWNSTLSIETYFFLVCLVLSCILFAVYVIQMLLLG